MTAPITPLESMDPDLLEHLAESLARRDWALLYQLGHLLAELFRQAFRLLGYGRFDAYTREVLGISSSTARRWMELTAGLDKYPLVRESFAAGRLCPAKIELLLPVLKKRPEEEAQRVEQAERLGVRALRQALAKDLEAEPDLVYASYELTGTQVLAWRQARETARAHLEAMVPRGEILEYVVADFLSGQERLGYEEVLMPSRPEREYALSPASVLKVELHRPELPRRPLELQDRTLELLEERKRVALRQGELLVEMTVRLQKRAPVGQFARERLGLRRSTAYKRMQRAHGCQRYPGLDRLSGERAHALLPLLDAGVAADAWIEFASETTLLELERWVRHVRWQHTFCYEEFCNWAWRAPNQGERAPEPQRLGLLPTLAQRPLEGALTMATRVAVQVLEVRRPRVGLDQVLGPVQVLEDGPRRRVGWMVPRDFYPLLAEGIDLAGDSLFSEPGMALDKMFKRFVKAYSQKKGGGRRGRIRRRDGHCCQAPGCNGRGKLHVHHVKFRSQKGSDADWNCILVCSACHRLIHELGTLKVSGQAPNDLTWTRPGERWERGRRVKIPPPIEQLAV